MFSGQFEEWPQFKVLWPKLAFPAFHFDQQTLASELMDHGLTGDALQKVVSVPTIGEFAFDHLWKRLSRYYDDPALSVDDALHRIENLKPVGEQNYSELIYFIGQVERSYNQLTTLDQLNCLTLRDVDMVCKKLPLTKRTEWQRIYYDLDSTSQLHPFPIFMRFLATARGIVSRLV